LLAIHPEVELSKYELLEELGHGGMATVYRARDPRLGRDVAIKVIHRHLRESPEVAARFRSEALAVAKVKHPNIVEVYDVSAEDEADKYLVVELIRGITLRQLLLERGPLPPEIAACIAVEVARGLGCAHREAVVHRDIKPENVLLNMDRDLDPPSGASSARVKLTDFGIAKLLDVQGVTHTGQVLGSPAHMAPEQIEGRDVDARADVFGAGVLLYEMLTGVLPFEGKNPAQVLRKVLDGVFLPAERQLPKVGSAYGKIANQALARLAEDRTASATVFGDALESELRSLGIQDVRREISKFLDEPDAYITEHERLIPEVISKAATAARAQGDVIRAASLFNRALAYRPDDTQLLAEVAGLARRGRLRRKLVAGALMITAVAGVGAGVYSWGRQETSKDNASNSQSENDISSEVLPGQAKTPPLPVVKKPPDVQIKVTLPDPVEPAQIAVVRSPRKSAGRLSKPSRPKSKGARVVRTAVVGPQNARVRIDGQLLQWYQRHTLSIGPHTFEFVPPNSECCETSPPTTVTIVAGEGVQVVRGVIKFRPAILRLAAPDGSRASCGIGGVIVAGASRTIPMDQPSRLLRCTIFPPAGENTKPRRIDADLRPGRTFTLRNH